MIRRFECKECKTRFEADDKDDVRCPHCQSDNVDFAKFTISPRVWKIVGGVIIVLAVVFALTQINWGNLTKNDAADIEDGLDPAEDTTEVVIVEGLDIPPTIETGNLKFEDNGYTFKVVVKNRPLGNTFIGIVNPLDKKIVAKSEDGEFKGVPYSQADGAFYTIALMNAADSILASIDKPGFIKQAHVATKMTVGELQKKMNSRDESLLGVGENDYLAPDYKLKFIGLPSDAINIPKILSEVFEKVDMEVWQSATVSALDYDDMNRIKTITLKVIVSSDNF